MDNDSVTPIGEDGRPRDAAVNSHCCARDAIGSDGDIGEFEIVLSCYSSVWNLWMMSVRWPIEGDTVYVNNAF